MDTKGTGQSYNAKDEDLIHQLINSRLEQKSQMEYEDLEGYELPPRTQFSMLKKPAVTIRYKQFTFNTAAIRLFEGVQHVLTILNPKKKRLAVVPCSQEESASVEWARQKDEKWINKSITSRKTGEVKKRRAVYYPDEYKDRIGKSYNDYVEARQLSIFEDLEGYVGQTYGDAHTIDEQFHQQE